MTDQRIWGYEIVQYWKGFPSSDVPRSGTVFQSHWNVIPRLCMFPVGFLQFPNMSMTCTVNLSNSGMNLWGLKDALVQLEHLMKFLVQSTNISPENLTLG